MGTDSCFSTLSNCYKCIYIIMYALKISGDYATELAENQGTDVDCHCQTFQPNLVPTSAVNQAHDVMISTHSPRE